VKRVATHPGGFHADDVFAMAALELVFGELEIVRTRDAGEQAAADIRVDVGGRCDPSTGDFDHHQRGGAGARPNGVPYAAFGLVWREFGAALAGSEQAAAAIDERLVQGVDANDIGYELIKPLVDRVRPMSVSGVIAGMNPAWDEELTPAEEDQRFAAAVTLARGILRREIAGAKAFARAQGIVREAIAAATDPRLIELPRSLPWRELVVREAPEALLVIYPKPDGWAMQAVPVAADSFTNRLDLPAAWAGLSGDALVEATGVPDAIFAHAARFYASAGSREGILALAALALDGAAAA
jgi:uncharacterized UPF0160 family protein